MKLSTRGRYATRAMLDLALYSGNGPVLVRDVARRQEISELYLKQLLSALRLAGLVRTRRGAHGGFTLARPPSQIKLIEIVRCMEGSTAPVDCLDNDGICRHSDLCVIRGVWAEVKKAVDDILESTTLQNLVERHKRNGDAYLIKKVSMEELVDKNGNIMEG